MLSHLPVLKLELCDFNLVDCSAVSKTWAGAMASVQSRALRAEPSGFKGVHSLHSTVVSAKAAVAAAPPGRSELACL